ncbi:MAG TPA: Sir2 family NAD-dependent protein deacetylase [Nevskiales bacterium]|nr:Sir2 family NAD-dependent protein deacetylase [Nevskiales bacterium]
MTQSPPAARAADLIAAADGLLITAGAGMGVDSGLPDFRGPEGFWRAYPALKHKGFGFTDIANPEAFRRNPRLAWGFYGHRLQLYRKTTPHNGFAILKRWAESKPQGVFVFTSNVDGHFQKADFAEDRIVECHGSIHRLQCAATCSDSIWPADDFAPDVDEENCLLRSPLPTCPACGALARPNILMFDDGDWQERRYEVQRENLRRWLGCVRRPVVIEIGAGRSVPTVRHFSESLGAPLIRINREAADASGATVSLPMNALEALQAIDPHAR